MIKKEWTLFGYNMWLPLRSVKSISWLLFKWLDLRDSDGRVHNIKGLPFNWIRRGNLNKGPNTNPLKYFVTLIYAIRTWDNLLWVKPTEYTLFHLICKYSGEPFFPPLHQLINYPTWIKHEPLIRKPVAMFFNHWFIRDLYCQCIYFSIIPINWKYSLYII